MEPEKTVPTLNGRANPGYVGYSYASTTDLALQLSQQLHKSDRFGGTPNSDQRWNIIHCDGCGDDWIKHSYIYEIPAVLRDIREALGDRRCEERHLLPHEERFSTSPVSIRSTPSAPRSMPPMATCRYICHRSSTTRHAPVITCLTPWLSSRLVGAYATFCRSLLLEITLKVSDLIRPLVAPAFTVGPLSTQSCWGLDNNVRMAYKWHQEVNLWHLYPAAGAPMDDVPGREEISDTRVK